MVKIAVKIGTIFDIPKNILTNLINENNQIDYKLNKNPQPGKARGTDLETNNQVYLIIYMQVLSIYIVKTVPKIVTVDPLE